MLHPKQQYKGMGSGWCPAPYCKEGSKWWTCLTCDSKGCGNHQVFNGGYVEYCWFCKPEKFGLDKTRKNTKK